MSPLHVISRLAGSALLVSLVLQLAVEPLLGAVASIPAAADLPSRIFFGFLSGFLTLAVLVIAVRRSSLSGKRLGWAVFTLLFGLDLLALPEAAAFLHLPWPQLVGMGLGGLVRAAMLTGLLLGALGKVGRPAASATVRSGAGLSWPSTVWRLGLCALSYLVLFIAAGLLIWPLVAEFYQQQPMIDPLLMFALELLRGVGLAAILLPLCRSLRYGRRGTALTCGLLLSLLGGAAVLIDPNPFMPGWVRLAHTLEIGWSNFVFGMIVGLLFALREGRKRTDEPMPDPTDYHAANTLISTRGIRAVGATEQL